MWNQEQIKDHKKAAEKLFKIKNLVFDLIKTKNGLSEFHIQKFILNSFKKENLKTDSYFPLVAFNKNIAAPYTKYEASKKKKIENNTLILIDIWAKMNSKKSPFADISWVAYKGNKIPKKIKNEFESTIKIRNKILQFIKHKLKKGKIPSGKEINTFAKDCLIKEGFNGKGYTGHCLGITGAHGNYANLEESNKKPLKINLGYALEPGMYSPGKYWIRNEINFYISKEREMILTTKMQNKIKKI